MKTEVAVILADNMFDESFFLICLQTSLVLSEPECTMMK